LSAKGKRKSGEKSEEKKNGFWCPFYIFLEVKAAVTLTVIITVILCQVVVQQLDNKLLYMKREG
jgi:hypothetical protein